jgi:hypothetical protein
VFISKKKPHEPAQQQLLKERSLKNLDDAFAEQAYEAI